MRALTAGLLISLVAFISCGRREAETPLTPAAGFTSDITGAIESISSARCDSEQRCGDIGPRATYMNRDHCMGVMRADGQDSLGECTLGIDRIDLLECVTQINNEDCGGAGGAIDRLERLAACRSGDLCVD
jgi:hypothetical protein